MKHSKYLFISIMLCLAILPVQTDIYASEEHQSIDTSRPENYKEMYQYLVANGIKYPKVFTAIAITESGWNLNSDIAAHTNNFFGFHYPYGGITTAIGEYNICAKYNTFQDALIDMRRWIEMAPPKYNEFPYSWLMRRGYNPKPSYYGYIKHIVDHQLKNLEVDILESAYIHKYHMAIR